MGNNPRTICASCLFTPRVATKLGVVVGDRPRIHLKGLFQVRCRRVDDFGGRELAAGNGIVFDNLHHVVDGICREIIHWNPPHGNSSLCSVIIHSKINVLQHGPST